MKHADGIKQHHALQLLCFGPELWEPWSRCAMPMDSAPKSQRRGGNKIKRCFNKVLMSGCTHLSDYATERFFFFFPFFCIPYNFTLKVTLKVWHDWLDHFYSRFSCVLYPLYVYFSCPVISDALKPHWPVLPDQTGSTTPTELEPDPKTLIVSFVSFDC